MAKQLPVRCKFPCCRRHPEKNGYCIGHRIHAKKSDTTDAKPGIRRVGEKMVGIKKELRKIIIAFLARPENKYCKIRIDKNCTVIATTVNHTRRRGENVLNEEDMELSCSYCNIKIEEKDGWARENGHLKSKFNKN